MSSLSMHNQQTREKKDRRCRDEHGEIARYGSNYALESNKALDVQQAESLYIGSRDLKSAVLLQKR